MIRSIIKPQPCAVQAIVDRLTGHASAETIDKILHLLDTEVRLITPTSSSIAPSVGSSTSMSGTAVEPTYQLTHDYLVPTIDP